MTTKINYATLSVEDFNKYRSEEESRLDELANVERLKDLNIRVTGEILAELLKVPSNTHLFVKRFPFEVLLQYFEEYPVFRAYTVHKVTGLDISMATKKSIEKQAEELRDAVAAGKSLVQILGMFKPKWLAATIPLPELMPMVSEILTASNVVRPTDEVELHRHVLRTSIKALFKSRERGDNRESVLARGDFLQSFDEDQRDEVIAAVVDRLAPDKLRALFDRWTKRAIGEPEKPNSVRTTLPSVPDATEGPCHMPSAPPPLSSGVGAMQSADDKRANEIGIGQAARPASSPPPASEVAGRGSNGGGSPVAIPSLTRPPSSPPSGLGRTLVPMRPSSGSEPPPSMNRQPAAASAPPSTKASGK